jgi:hypothetical protein
VLIAELVTINAPATAIVAAMTFVPQPSSYWGSKRCPQRSWQQQWHWQCMAAAATAPSTAKPAEEISGQPTPFSLDCRGSIIACCQHYNGSTTATPAVTLGSEKALTSCAKLQDCLLAFYVRSTTAILSLINRPAHHETPLSMTNEFTLLQM